MSITILFFASAREAAGVSQTQLDIPATGWNTQQLRHVLAELYPALQSLVLDEESVTFALNEEYIPAGEHPSLKSGDTVALIPPISGG
jgi:molybdopterin converting factor subunit 1